MIGFKHHDLRITSAPSQQAATRCAPVSGITVIGLPRPRRRTKMPYAMTRLPVYELATTAGP